jgi:hypothetical protein
MKTLILIMLLLKNIYPQQDSQLNLYLQQSASAVNTNVQNIEEYFGRFKGNSESDPAALAFDTTEVYYFDIVFSQGLEYNLYTGQLDVNFSYLVEDEYCKNSKRNGVLLLEKTERIPAVKKEPEKVNRMVYVLIPDKCSTTRFYSSEGEMFCDNKKQFNMEAEEGRLTAETLNVRIGMQLLSNTRLDYYKRFTPAEANFPVETIVEENVLRCCIRSIIFMRGDEIMENYVSLK